MNDTHNKSLSSIYQKSKIEEPPMRLDSAILSQGRKAVEKRKSLWCKVHWLIPLSSFAITLLTATLYIQMKQEHPEILEPSSIAPLTTLQTEERLKDDIQQHLKKRTITSDKEQTKTRTAAPASAMEMKSAPIEMEASPAKNLMEQPKKLKRETIGASQFRSRESLSEADSVAPVQSKVPKSPIISDPETWVAKIRILLEQKRRNEAINELEAFKAAHPDYQLPPDLKTLSK